MPSETPTAPPGEAGAGLQREQMHRLHPFTLIQRFLISAPALFVILLPAIRNPNAGAWVSIGSLLLYGVFVIPIFVAQYLRFRYAVTPDEIVIHKGVFTYQHRNIPIERIQNIEIEQSLVPRMFGTARVKIETAGSRSTEGVIEYVGLEEARRIRSKVRAHQRARTAEGGPGEAVAEARGTDVTAEPTPGEYVPKATEHEDESGALIHRMTLGRVLLSGAFRFSLLYIVAIFTAVEYLGVDPEEMARLVAGERFAAAVAVFQHEPWLVVLATAFMVLLLAWLTGIATNLNRFYGFRLSLDDNKLHFRHGLLTVSEGTIPLKKVQALLVRTNPLMSAFGWYRLELQTMGFDPSDRGYRVAAPFTRWPEIMSIARIIRPVEEPGELESVSRLMIRRTFVRYFVALAVLAGGAGYFWEPALWGFTAVPVLGGLAVLQYRHHGYRISDEYLYVRRGVLRESYWIIPVDRFQVFYLTQSLFQRRLGLRSVYVDTPGSGAMMHPEVVDLDADDAFSVLGALHRRFHDLFHGRRGPPAGL